MIIVLDVGNTNTKIGIFDGDRLVEGLRLSSSISQTGDEYGFYLVGMLKAKSIEPKDITGGIISSVNPNLNYTFEHMLDFYFGIKPYVVGAGIKTGINIKYDNPKEVGGDRIVGSVAAYKIYGGPCIVIDCGTATTFNVISSSGEFLGGAIGVGLKSSADALYNGTAKLPKVELSVPKTVIGKMTVTNMQSGLVFGYVSMIEGMVARIKKEMGIDLKVIATGGLSEIVASCSNVIDVVDRTLTLKGLNIVYKMQTE
ncbi:MAG: type III pantothenate kinase [Clostridiales bacterium]|nr:type III pantothenate kinase [Clostridiales bacterium]